MKVKNQYQFYYPDLTKDSVFIVDKDLLFQMIHVLRMKLGKEVSLLDGRGLKAVGIINKIEKTQISIQILKKEIQEPSKQEIHLVLSAVKKEKIKEVLAKATQIGVSSISIVESEFSNVSIQNLVEKKDSFLATIKESLEQSGNFYLPGIFFFKDYSEYFNHGRENSLFIVAHSDNENKSISREFLPFFSVPVRLKNYILFVGSEGGYSEQEITFFKEKGCQFCSLGDNILKVETACIVGLAYLVIKVKESFRNGA